MGAGVGLSGCFGSFLLHMRIVVGYWFGVVGASFEGSVVVPDFDLGGDEAASASEGSDVKVWIPPVWSVKSV